MAHSTPRANFEFVKVAIDVDGNEAREWGISFDPPLRKGEVVRVQVPEGVLEYHG